MKTTTCLLFFVCTIIIFCCEKDNPPAYEDNNTSGFDIDIDKYQYYNEEIFSEKYIGIYDKWLLNGISGGFSGTGYSPDFEQLVIEEIGIFKFFRNDSLLNYGKIVIDEQNENQLLVSFALDSSIGNMGFFDMVKYVYLNDSLLTLNAPCCDRFNYHFTKCAVYSDSIFYQENSQIDNIVITQIPVPEGKYFISVFFTDIYNGYLLCNDNTILKTKNGGNSWLEYAVGTDLPLYSLLFISENIGFIVGGESGCSGSGCKPRGSIVLKTVNGGTNWIKQSTPDKGELYSISFIDDNIGFAVGRGLLIKTYNGGITWEEYIVDNTGVIEKIFFLNSKTGFMCGLFNNIFRTSDAGKSWINLTEHNPDRIMHFLNIQFINDNIGFLSGQNCKLLKTVDGGNSFMELPNSPTGISSIYFKNENEGIVFGNRSYSNGNCNVWQSNINLTVDGGNKWQGDNKVSGNIQQISVLDNNVYFGILNYTEIIKIELK